MFVLTDLDNRLAEHMARVDRVSREGWMRQEQVAIPSASERPRQRAGTMLIRFVAWIRLMRLGHAGATAR